MKGRRERSCTVQWVNPADCGAIVNDIANINILRRDLTDVFIKMTPLMILYANSKLSMIFVFRPGPLDKDLSQLWYPEPNEEFG
jgi:hypothetical protein